MPTFPKFKVSAELEDIYLNFENCKFVFTINGWLHKNIENNNSYFESSLKKI